MQRIFLFAILASVPWLVIAGWNIGLNAGNEAGRLINNFFTGANAGQEPAVWAFYPETVWMITVVWVSAILAVLIARKLLNRSREVSRSSQ